MNSRRTLITVAIVLLNDIAAARDSHQPNTSHRQPKAMRPSMDQAAFWKLIATARSGAANDEVFVERMAAVLRRLSPDELLEYERQFDRVHAESYGWKLWGAAYLINGGCSDDGFEYFRAWLTAQGQPCFREGHRKSRLAGLSLALAVVLGAGTSGRFLGQDLDKVVGDRRAHSKSDRHIQSPSGAISR